MSESKPIFQNPELQNILSQLNNLSRAELTLLQFIIQGFIEERPKFTPEEVTEINEKNQKAIDELQTQTKNLLDGETVKHNVYPHQIAFNCIPHIDIFLENGYTKEEMKMVDETRKILGDSSVLVSPTAVRVPVFYCHSESVNVETEKPISAKEVKELLAGSDGIRVVDNPENNEYPLATDGVDRDEVLVGRIRDDISCENAINFWVVSDNLRKGAALNAVQIAEYLVQRA
jgi:aspartate-semialdehyde dehydrogenase